MLQKDVAKEVMTNETRNEILGRIYATTKLEDLGEADIVIEAISENYEVKRNLFTHLSEVIRSPQSTILASNTSSISITKLAATYCQPERFVGMHFMNPVPVMKLVEIICGKQTSEHTLSTVRELATRMGKTTTTSQDIPGFIANRPVSMMKFRVYLVHSRILPGDQRQRDLQSRRDSQY